MALPITAAELALLDVILAKTRTALTEGGGGIPSVVSAADFDSSVAVSDGTRLNAIGMLQALESGVILRSPNGTYYRLTVNDAGAVIATTI